MEKMYMDRILSFDLQLQPISLENPVGEDLRLDSSPTSIYYQIKDARARARNFERNAAFNPEGFIEARKEWIIVEQLTNKVLSTKTKDLEIASWLVESLLRIHNFEGLHQGFRFLKELIAQFWGKLYPLPDEEGIITTLAQLINLNGQDSEGVLIQAIKNSPLTAGNSLADYTYTHYQQALDLARITDNDKLNDRLDKGAVSMEMIKARTTETSKEYFVALIESIKNCLSEYTLLNLIIEEKCNNLVLPSSRIQNALQACLDCVQIIAKDKLVAFSNENLLVSADTLSATNEISFSTGSLTKIINNREQAFSHIELAAAYFRQAEPHSPLAYVLERSIRWGKMSLPALMAEMISDDSARKNLFNLAGITEDNIS